MLCRRYWPTKHLQGVIAWYWTLERPASTSEREVYRLIPDTYVDWVFHLGTPWQYRQAPENHWCTSKAHMFGHSTHFLEITLNGDPLLVFGVKFHPWSAASLWETGMNSTTNLELTLQDLSLSGMRDLEDQVLTTSSIPSCIALVEEYLSQRLVELNNLRPIIQQYYQGIATPSTDLQTRRLQQRFKHEIGISPKTFQRTIRINQVIERLVAGPAKLTDLAYQAGYFDQSHFIRDFRHFTGLTPRTFLKSINPSGDFFNLRIH